MHRTYKLILKNLYSFIKQKVKHIILSNVINESFIVQLLVNSQHYIISSVATRNL